MAAKKETMKVVEGTETKVIPTPRKKLTTIRLISAGWNSHKKGDVWEVTDDELIELRRHAQIEVL